MKKNKTLEEIGIRIVELQAEIAKLKWEKAKKMVDLRKEGLSYQKIGEKVGVSRQRIHQILRK